MITAIILTKNEEKNIAKCIKSVSWCDEIIVMDDYSTDSTLKIAKKLGAKIYKRHLNNNFASQRNFALQQVRSKDNWILFIDADEIVSKKLQKEIKSRVITPREGSLFGFYLYRCDYFLGKELKHGETGNVKLLRLAKRNSGKWKRKVHEYWDIKGNIIELKNPIIHHKSQGLTGFITKINNYSSIHAIELKKERKKSNIFKIVEMPMGKFVQNFIFNLGFLDGTEGFIMAMIMSFHSFLAWSKSWMD